MTKKFPDPADRFRLVSFPQFEEPLRQVVPETERRESHLRLIPDTHSLKPLALQCLKKENERPSALQLSERLSELKRSPLYLQSIHRAQRSPDIQQLQLALHLKTQEAKEQQTRLTELEGIVNDKDAQILEQQRHLLAKERQLEQSQCAIATRDQALERKERELQQTQEQLQTSEQLQTELQQSLKQKDKTISELQETISDHERKIQQLQEQGDWASRDQLQQEPITTPQTKVAAAQNDISNTRWREGNSAPQAIARGATVVHENTAYLRPYGSHKVLSYENDPRNPQWSQLPDNSKRHFGLAVIGGLLTSVGGLSNGTPTNTLLSLTGERKQWSEIFPPMPTPRSNVACVTTEQALVVAGGYGVGYLDNVEVMNTDTKVWTELASLPEKSMSLTATLFDNRLYSADGVSGYHSPSKSVFTCSLPHLLSSNTPGSRTRQMCPGVWENTSSLPVTKSTLVPFRGHLLAIGGRDDADNPTSDVYRYDSHTDSWTVASQTKNRRSLCVAVTFPGDLLMVVGGQTVKRGPTSYIITRSVEILK